MKVKDAIEALQKLDPEAILLKKSDNFEQNGATVPVSHFGVYPSAKEKRVTFRDAFDGDTYESTVYDLFDGDISAVNVS